MEPGEKELRKIFEKTTTANVRAVIAYNDLTQELVRKLEKKTQDLDGVVRQYDAKIANISHQLSALLAKVYQGGS